MQKQFKELDYIRVISMFAVIMIHVSSKFIFVESKFSVSGINLAFFLNQVSRFSVPMFVLLSGVGLSLKYSESFDLSAFSIKEFYAKSFVKILVPYSFWSVTYMLYKYEGISRIADGTIPLSQIIREFFLGGFASHLYFIVVLVQMYLLFPFLMQMKAKRQWNGIITITALSFIFQILLHRQGFQFNLPDIVAVYAWETFLPWIHFFIIGMLIDRKSLEKLIPLCQRVRPALILSFVLYIIVFTLDSFNSNSYASSLKPQITLYTLLALASILSVCPRKAESNVLDKLVHFLSKHSMTIYFSHILFLVEFRKLDISNGMSGLMLQFAAVSCVSIILSFIFDKLIEMLPSFFSKKKTVSYSS